MAYDENLADRIRELIYPEGGVAERRMFGGLAFLVGGHIAVAASGGGLMVRIDPSEATRLCARPHVQPAEMHGRAMAGWLSVHEDGLRTKRQLEPWIRRGVVLARSLPPKN